YLARRVASASTSGVRELVLDDRDLAALTAADSPPAPDSACVIAKVAASSNEALQRGDFELLLSQVVGPPGAFMMGRFCRSLPGLAHELHAYLRAEAALQPDVILAEVVHLPEGQQGSLVFRPVLRDHEIPYLGRSGAPPAGQIPITDLHVSVVDGRVVL